MTNIYFFDIDNTLLDHRSNTIPQTALDSIAALKRAGHTVVIATGRSYGHAKPFVDQIRPSYVITQNGARILKDEQEVLTVPLAKQPLLDLFDWIHAQGHHYGVNDGLNAHVSASAPDVLAAFRSVAMTVASDVDLVLEQDVYQAWLFFAEALDTSLMPEILARYPDFGLVRWHTNAVDVLPKATNKWTGCQWVMQQTGFEPRQAIAFGDGLNDIEMLQGVGLGVAMDNGHAELKAVAKRIAPALHLDGVATMLDELAQAKKRERMI
jgi:Cof subfamily protein (haloacid dehalogenase superfamily)